MESKIQESFLPPPVAESTPTPVSSKGKEPAPEEEEIRFGSRPTRETVDKEINYSNPYADGRKDEYRFCFVQLNSLIKLLKMIKCKCNKYVEIDDKIERGSCVYFKLVCKSKTCDTKISWTTSDTSCNGGWSSNKALIASFAMAGGCFEQFSTYMDILGCPAPAESTWYKFTKTTLGPAIRKMESIQEKAILCLITKYLYPIVIAHDVRHDHTRSAEHATVTFMAENLYHIIVSMRHAHVLAVRDASGNLTQSSSHLDSFITKIGMNDLFREIGDLIEEIVRDGNSSYKTIMEDLLMNLKDKTWKRNNEERKLNLKFVCLDGWHKAKKLSKKYPFKKIKKEAAIVQNQLSDKQQPIVNHFFFCLEYVDNQVEELHKSKHLTPADYTKLHEEQADKLYNMFHNCVMHWMGIHDSCVPESPCKKDENYSLKLVKITSPRAVVILTEYLDSVFPRDEAIYYLRNRMTSHAESFNRMLLHFVPKFKTFLESYDWRVDLAKLDWNENAPFRDVILQRAHTIALRCY